MKGGYFNMYKNKRGQVVWIVIAIIAVVVIVGAIVMTRPQQQLESQTDIVSTLGTCDVEPYFTKILTDKTNPGTSITSTKSPGRVNGAYVGDITPGSSGTILSIGDNLNLVVNGSDYISIEGNAEIDKCGENEVPYQLCKLDGAPSITIFGTAGDALTDNRQGGATNQTASANTIVVDMHFTMPSDECADSVVFVVEASNSTEVDKISMGTNVGNIKEYPINKPDIHSDEGGNSDSLTNTFIATGFANDGGKTVYSITLEPESGETMGTGNSSVYVTAYFPQAFADVDGTIKTDIENTDGTATHVTAASTDYDFCIGTVC
jgi:hypothetical protein